MRILIVGAGGHAHVVADILLRAREAGAGLAPVGLVDDDERLVGSVVLGLPVVGTIAGLGRVPHDVVVVAIGDNATRKRLFERLRDGGERFAIARHPSAVIASDVVIGDGTMVCAGAIVNPGSVVGANAILNTACSVDHHNHVGDHAHVAPGAHTASGVRIDEGALLGVGAAVVPGVRIGAWSRVGAGAAVIDDVPDGITVAGVPARPLRAARR